jgi:flagellar hook-length control protein FliK
MKATAAKQARQPAPAPKPAKPASTAKPKHTAADSSDSQGKHTSSAGNAGKPKAAPSASPAAANAQSGQDSSAPDDAAASEANAVANGAKGRAPARTAPKNTDSQDIAAKNAADGSTDPSTESTNQSGLSLLQLLARSPDGDKSLPSDDTDTTVTDAAAPAATDKTSADGTDKTSDDPNAIALAMFSQALAAALARQPSPTANTGTGDATTGITSATQSPGGAVSIQDLMSVLTQDVAADAKVKSDDGATQFNVDPTKDAASDASGTDTTAMGPNALAHLSVASHFAAQHLRNDTNTADLKSPVGSSEWQDEVGTHLTWMTQKGLETGSLRVSPEHLGPVEVNIAVQNGDASVWFAANHPDTRAALEQALPRLREMFANQGMNLADSGVSRQSYGKQSRSGASQAVTGVSAVGAPDDKSSASARINLGLVDLYA